MQKYIKAGLLIIVLVVPALIFLFLQGYTANHFDLPYYVPLRNPMTHEVLVKGEDTVFYQVKDFSLTSVDSTSAITSAQLLGKTVVLSAFKSPCDAGCEKTLSELNRINVLHETYPSLSILTIINENEESLSKVARYQKAGWEVVMVPDSTYQNVVQGTFHLLPEDLKGQTISFNNRLSLLDGKGYIRGYYDGEKTEDVERLLAEIRVLEYNRKTAQK